MSTVGAARTVTTRVVRMARNFMLKILRRLEMESDGDRNFGAEERSLSKAGRG